ncbi:MAG: 16S rRNA (guanine(966)-N(2))-methyltransferase RsmD [Clostridia bacterium]|nr:16S rRNA (guanine(966)-N(2))-methyltransferase RsmD [Clostridia bacterium]
MRIIAGEKKGRTLIAPKGEDTRPTLERVKEAVFGIVQFELYGSHVLDLFAGSGALGIEALSRGADKCVFCDKSRVAMSVVKQNLAKVGYEDKAQLLEMDFHSALNSLSASGELFDVVFVDPPYADGLFEDAIDALINGNLLKEVFTIIVEHDKRVEIMPREGLSMKTKHYGDVRITVIRGE